MPNPPFLEPSALTVSGYPTKQIGDYAPVIELTLTGTNPQQITGQSSEVQFATLSCTGADVFVLVDNQTTVFASPSNYNFIIGDGDNFIDFRMGKQRHTCCLNAGETASLKVAIAQEEIIII